jgi:CubicO group peptidase (beta-lactamase class C family)
MRLAIAAVFLLIATPGQAAREVPAEGIQPSGMSNFCTKVDCVDSLSKFRTIREIEPSASPTPLRYRTDLGFSERHKIGKANAIFSANPTLAMILIDKGEIILERYHPEITEKTPLLGYSMSKSLTSMTVGKAHCAGDLRDLDVQAKAVNPSLGETAYGEATVRQLLMMASGAIRGSAPSGGSPYRAGLGNPADRPVYWSSLNQLRKFGANQPKQDGALVQAGEEFSYKNLDTQALAFLFPTTGEKSFTSVFESAIWQASGAEDKGYWIHDSAGTIYTMASFHATARDWARLAMALLDSVASPKGDCYGDYIKEATTTRIRNNSRAMGEDYWIGRAFAGYGYQFWTLNDADPDAIYLNGALGQRIAISPKKQRIMVVFSHAESYMGELYRFFAEW